MQGSTKHSYIGYSMAYRTKEEFTELLKRFAPPNCEIVVYRVSLAKGLTRLVPDKLLQKGCGNFEIPRMELCPAAFRTQVMPLIENLKQGRMTTNEIQEITIVTKQQTE